MLRTPNDLPRLLTRLDDLGAGQPDRLGQLAQPALHRVAVGHAFGIEYLQPHRIGIEPQPPVFQYLGNAGRKPVRQ